MADNEQLGFDDFEEDLDRDLRRRRRPRRRNKDPEDAERPPGWRSQRALWALRVLDQGQLIVRATRSYDTDIFEDAGLDPEAAGEMKKRQLWRVVRQRLLEVEELGAERDEPLFDNVKRLGDALGLDAVEQEVLCLAVTGEICEGLTDALGYMSRMPMRHRVASLARILDIEPQQLRPALAPRGNLTRLGLVKFREGIRQPIQSTFGLPEGFADALAHREDDLEAILARFFTLAPAPTRSLDDFAHVPELDLILDVIRSALRGKDPGVNVLLHGPPGNGKTELARLIGKTLAEQTYEVPVINKESKNDEAQEGRLTAKRIADRLLGSVDDILMIFDEFEDAFPATFFGPFQRTGSTKHKGWTHEILEHNRTPCLWLGNEIGHMDPALLRRFDLIVEMPPPPVTVRERILRAHTEALELSDDWLSRMAADERLSPAHAAQAARVARRMALEPGPTTERAMERILDANLAVKGPRRTAVGTAREVFAFELTLLNTELPVDDLVEGLGAASAGSVCLHGPPGTGKTAFVREVGRRLGLEVDKRSASQLLGALLGESEKRIAGMFRHAARSGAILFVDEADSLLRSRGGAVRSWEVTQVNELLVQLEAFPGIFFAATNALDVVDTAALRRFDVTVGFSAPTTDQRVRLLTMAAERLELSLPDAATLRREAAALDGVTPGDVAAAVRGSRLLRATQSFDQLLDTLKAARSAKEPRRVAGFGR